MRRRTNWHFVFVLLVAAVAVGGWAAREVTPFLGAGVFLCATACAAREALLRRVGWRRFAVSMLLLGGLPAILLGCHQLRCWYQPRPDNTRQMLFEGVEYIREVLLEPDVAIVHILKVDLTTPGVRVLVTPPDSPGQLRAVRGRTTSQFVAEFGLQAAINASNYFPFERHNPWTYWPYAYEPKGILGGAASDGVQYGEPDRYYPILHVTPDNHASIAHDLPRPWHTATAGVKHFIVDGEPIHMRTGNPEATTAVAIDATGTVLFLVVVDGEQPPYSAGTDRPTLAALLLRYGVHNALGLDSGGSSTMVVADTPGQARVVNRPVQGGVPGFERPVGNHIGIYAPPLKAP